MAAPIRTKFLIATANVLQFIWACSLLQIIIGVTSVHYDGEFEGFLLCRKCGYEVAKAQDLASLPSSMALRQRNDTISNSNKVLIQLFKNPNDVYFELITSLESELESDTQKFTADSWFPGYAWSIAKCPKCGTHIGWSYHALAGTLDSAASHVTTFFGLILDKIMHEDDVNNLIAMPKTYAS